MLRHKPSVHCRCILSRIEGKNDAEIEEIKKSR